MPATNYNHLPKLIQDGLEAFTSDTEKEVFVLSSLVTISSVFPTFTGIYAGEVVNANLYGFIVARAASGKSAMQFAKMLAEPIHKSLLLNSALQAPVEEAKNTKNKQPEMLFIPGNSSSAAIINILKACKNGNLLAESEADTLSDALSKEFGNFSDMLRKAYHHEAISKARAMDNEYIEITNPKLSVLLTGTPDQVRGLIPSAENGLFSRFAFLYLDAEDEWMDVSPQNRKQKAEIIKPLADKLLEYYTYAKDKTYHFELSDTQWDIINATGIRWLQTAKQYGQNGGSIAKRHGLMIYRFAMVISILNHFEDGLPEGIVKCYDQDLATTLELCDNYFYHSLDIYTQMSKRSAESLLKPKAKQLYEALPKQFKSGKQLESIANKFGIKERSARNYLDEFKSKNLIKPGNDTYVWQKVS